MASRIAHDILKFWVSYDPITGEFVWLRGHRRAYRAGTPPTKTREYRRVCIENVEYLEHVLAWFYMTGSWPTGQIDHYNRNPIDNRWCNLRDVSPSVNSHNKGAYRNNSSGFTGVSFCKRNGRWAAQIRKNRRTNWLGYHSTPEQAHDVYLREKTKMKEWKE